MKLGQAIDRVLRNVNELGLGRAPECYAVSEAVYRLTGGKDAGIHVMRIPMDFQSHWFLRGPYGEIIDLTAGQFNGEYPDYRTAVRAAFYPQCSNLAKELMK